ncbi:MAG: Adenine-specific methylase containing a Zn-ribbon-like protein [Solirubrobacterales bacterium]|nr:Adenine-specific methylase containing a Zn-ribbon-like protein [Solirubrobacterales bacterium]
MAQAPHSILQRIDWPALDLDVARQQRNREVYAPAVSLFRWWARRPHALIGEILDAAGDADLRVSDPFSGGGTVALEAVQRGLDIYAQDLHPWAATGLATALDQVDPEALEQGGEAWLSGLSGLRKELYGANCATHGDSETLTTFWVRRAQCPGCDGHAYLYPYSMVTRASRAKGETDAYFGCGGCGAITRSAMTVVDRRCSNCGHDLRDPDKACVAGGRFHCCAPGCGETFQAFAAKFTWQPVLVQRLCGGLAHFDRLNDGDRDAAVKNRPVLPAPLVANIPSGIETRRLRNGGIIKWADLYPARQLDTMLTAAAAIDEMQIDPAVANRLRLILCGAAEMAGYASRWDRHYPKAFEVTANHRFSLTGLAAETNLLAERGRGTLVRRLGHSVRAARWANEFEGRKPLRLNSRRGDRLKQDELGQPTVVQGSSTSQLLPDNSVDLVLTDPPYFDDIQYAELGALFLVWAQATSLVSKSIRLDLRSEVVPNSTRGTDAARYCELLTSVLRETARTLKTNGRVILTFHNTAGQAWWALARALGHAGFSVSALAVGHAENESDHSKRGRRAFSHDLVLECRRGYSDPKKLVVANKGTGPQSEQLVAAGLAVADLAAELAGKKISRTRSYRTFGKSYRRHLGEGPSTYIRLGKPIEGH